MPLLVQTGFKDTGGSRDTHGTRGRTQAHGSHIPVQNEFTGATDR